MLNIGIRARICIRLAFVSFILSAVMVQILLSTPIRSLKYSAVVIEFILYDVISFYILLFELIAKHRGSCIHIIMLIYFIPIILHNDMQLSLIKRSVLTGVTVLKAVMVHMMQYTEHDIVSQEIFTVIKMRMVAVQSTNTSLRRLLYMTCLNNLFSRAFLGYQGRTSYSAVFLTIDSCAKLIEIRSLMIGHLTRLLGGFLFLGIKWTVAIREKMIYSHSEAFTLFIAIMYMTTASVEYELNMLKIWSKVATPPTL